METALYTIDLLGTLVFAISGALAGMAKKFDLVGVFILGLVTAIGGGTLRDVMIGQTPVGWMKDLNYLMMIALSIPLCYLLKKQILKLRRSMFLFDTIGIGLFTILGLEKTLSLGLHPIVAVMMGTVSAVFGGVIRDVLANEVPLIFRKEIYASACVAGGVTYLLVDYFFKNGTYNIVVSILVVFVIRYLAVKRNWQLSFNSLGH